jgi:opacity protein-like surface antigen
LVVFLFPPALFLKKPAFPRAKPAFLPDFILTFGPLGGTLAKTRSASKGGGMMRQAGSKGLTALVLVCLLGLASPVQGVDFDFSQFNQELGLRFGYGKSTHKASVHLYSLLPRWGIFLLRPGRTLGPLGLSFVMEGIISVADAEETGFELGFTPMLKLSYILFPGVLAFVEGGAGIITESIDSPAIAHSFNFTPQVGGGVDIALSSQLAFTAAYRFRHSSNAGIYKENPAFNCNFFQAGLSYYY